MSPASRRTSLALGCAALLSLAAPAHGAAASGGTSSTPRAAVVAVAPASATDDGAAAPTTTIVDSGGPLPQVGPILVPTDDNGVSTRWWLVAFGGVQVIGLFLVTRRARSRLVTHDIQP